MPAAHTDCIFNLLMFFAKLAPTSPPWYQDQYFAYYSQGNSDQGKGIAITRFCCCFHVEVCGWVLPKIVGMLLCTIRFFQTWNTGKLILSWQILLVRWTVAFLYWSEVYSFFLFTVFSFAI